MIYRNDTGVHFTNIGETFGFDYVMLEQYDNFRVPHNFSPFCHGGFCLWLGANPETPPIHLCISTTLSVLERAKHSSELTAGIQSW